MFHQPAAARTLEEKLADAGFVHSVTGVCPTVALHVQWDLPGGLADVDRVQAARRVRLASCRARSIRTSFRIRRTSTVRSGNVDAAVRRQALEHGLESVAIAAALGSRDVSCWFADGSNYPGTANIRERKRWFEEGLREMHAHLAPGGRLLVEYKPFEPAFYHTDIADWGMALLLARAAGPSAKVLVDTGHHYAAQNIEQIVAWLLAENMLGGFHFNDRRYADDDLTIGSIDPYQVFRIFHEIRVLRVGDGRAGRHRVRDRSEPQPEGQDRSDDPDGRDGAGALRQGGARRLSTTRGGSARERPRVGRDVPSGRLRDGRAAGRSPSGARRKSLPVDPLDAFRESGYLDRITKERQSRGPLDCCLARRLEYAREGASPWSHGGHAVRKRNVHVLHVFMVIF